MATTSIFEIPLGRSYHPLLAVIATEGDSQNFSELLLLYPFPEPSEKAFEHFKLLVEYADEAVVTEILVETLKLAVLTYLTSRPDARPDKIELVRIEPVRLGARLSIEMYPAYFEASRNLQVSNAHTTMTSVKRGRIYNLSNR